MEINMKSIWFYILIAFAFFCGVLPQSKWPEPGKSYSDMYTLVEKESLTQYIDKDDALIAMAVIDSIQNDSMLIGNFVSFFVGKGRDFYDSIIFRSLQEKDIQEYYCIFDSTSLKRAMSDYSTTLGDNIDSSFLFNSTVFEKEFSAYLEYFRGVHNLFSRLINKYDKLNRDIQLDIDCDDEIRQRLWVMPEVQNPSYWKRAKAKSDTSFVGYNFEQLFNDYSFPYLLWYENQSECPPRCVGLSNISKGLIRIPFFYRGNYVCDISFSFK
jgi:hypothetical protein